MGRVVLDASALLTFLNDEPGADAAAQALEDDPVMSAVNVAEAATKMVDLGLDPADVGEMLEGLGIDVVAFDEVAAYHAAALRSATRRAGLSLGDRACLSLGMRLGLPVLTADQAWRSTALPVEVLLLR